MNFLFVDRIYEFTPSHSAKGIKHVTASDPYLQKAPHEERLILPACIIGEALGQLTAWIVMQACDFKQRPVAGIVDEVKIERQVCVGETLCLHTEIEKLDDQGVLYNSYATVCDEKVFSLQHSMGPLLPMETFIDPNKAIEQFSMIHRLGIPSLPALKMPFANKGVYRSNAPLHENRGCFFDHILAFTDKGAQAVKNISLLAPFFEDHFPRKPVFPLTLLLQGKLELADLFLQHLLGKEKARHFRPVSLRKIRIKQFIAPGDSLMITLALKETKDHFYRFELKTYLEEKAICSFQATFEKKHVQ